jgi:hypothetical protein
MDEYMRYTELCESIKTLDNKVDAILLKLDAINRDTSKMSSHIDFIDKTYDTMSSPLMWMCDKVNAIRGIKTETLPAVIKSNIEDQD